MLSPKIFKNPILRRKMRVRSSIRKNARGRHRLTVFRSNKHIYAQVIDDTKGITLVTASSLEESIRKLFKESANIEVAKKVGDLLAKRCKEQKIKEVVFDRGGYLYHGKIKAVADSARESGMVF